MAERSKADDSEGLEKQLQSLLSRYTGDELGVDSERFCADFCALVERTASRWQVPLPQLRILEVALRCFSHASTFLPTNCDRVQHTISSLALSVFELLLYFTQKDFSEEPLPNFTATFQECHSVLAKYQNVYLLQVECMVQAGGPWASPALQAILSEPSLPQNEVDGYISSEKPVFFELRVRYLSFCGRVSEAVALAKFCVKHPAARQHLFFHQVYLSWLYKTLQHELLQKEVADINGKDAVHIICNLECEETDKLLLALTTVFLRQQLQRGDMYYLCDLVRVWTNLHSRLKTSKLVLLEECRQLMFSATNVKSIFPFIRAILQEVGDDGIHFCVELCANALQSCLSCDVFTKTLIYKTIAGLLPDDLEVCRACALLVFFLERTVESYKMVYLLYMLPDQEYHVDDSPIGNNVRFETLQILKKDLYFDPEFWNLVALRTNCLKLLSEKVVSAALEEIMEDKWISKYSTKEFALRSCATVCHRGARDKLGDATKKRHQDKVYQKESDTASKRLRMGTEKTRLNDHSLRRKSNQALKESPGYLRRSFWQLDRIHNLTLRYDDHRRATRLSETNLPKRKIKKPRWLLEDSGALEENVPLKMKKNGLRPKKHLRSCVVKRSEPGPIKNTKHKPSVKTLLKARENDYQNGFSLDCSKPAPPPQVVLELSLPDNELIDTFMDDACSKPRTVPQVLLYKSTVKFPDTSPPGKTVHGKEVILRARDANMLVHQLHCYARRQRGKGSGASVHGSVSIITRSSAQGSPSKDSPGELCEKPVSELDVGTVQTGKQTGSQAPDEVLTDQSTKPELQQTSAVELFENPPKPDGENITTSPDVLRIAYQPTGSVTESSACTTGSPENSPTVEGIAASPTLAEKVMEEPLLHDASQAQTITATGEPFEEPAVEMKVTIASQSPVLDKVPESPTEDIPKTQVSQTAKSDKNKKVAADEIQAVSISPDVSNTGATDPLFLNSQDVAMESRDDGENATADGSSISMMDVAEDSQKDSKVNVPCKGDTNPVKTVVRPCEPSETNTSTNKAKISGKTAPTVTDLVELDDHFKDERQTPGSRVSKDSRVGSKPKVGLKTPTTSRCSVSEQEVSVVDRQETRVEATQDAVLDMPENSEFMESLPEPEESKLEHYCTFCSKDFKGPRVVEHAMFHYRKDECTFCRLIFKDDLLAMVHLSDHIEKLKRCRDQEDGVSVTKDTSTPKTAAKAKTASTPSGCQGKGKGRKFSVCSESIVNITTLESRTLRSNHKQASGTSLHELQKHGDASAAAHRVNGHIGQKTEITRLTNDLDKNKEFAQQKSSQKKRDEAARSHRKAFEMESSVQVDQDLKSRENGKSLKMDSKQNVDEKKNAKPQEKLCCPADGCSWFADISKNKVTLLYHALEKHYGEIKPLELAFRVADNKCSICMRVLFSFEHFQHHVKRHRLVPRHPCLHLGCTERFKTGMEMRRHARKHSPLQATCCLPGCSKLFICLWALNLHEKEHYASKSVKHEKSTDVHTGDKLCETPNSKNPVSEGNTESTSGYGTESIKASRRLREQATSDSTRKNTADPAAPASTRSLKNKPEVKNETIFSNTDTSVQPSVSNIKLGQTLGKFQATSASLNSPKVRKITSSSLLKYRSKLRCKLKTKQGKLNTRGCIGRGRPSKMSRAAAHIEKPTRGQKHSSQQTVTIRRVSNRIKVVKEKNREVKAVEKTADVSNLKKSEGKHITKNQVPVCLNKRAISKNQRSIHGKIQKFPTVKNSHVRSDSSKSQKNKITKAILNKKVNKSQQQNVSTASKKPATPKSTVQQKVKSSASKVKTEVEGSTQINSDSYHAASSTETTMKNERDETKISVAKNEEKALTEKQPSENKTSTLKTISKSKCDPKQQDKAKGAAMILQGLQRLIKSTLDVKEKRKEASAPSIPTDTVDKAHLSSATEEIKPKLNGHDHAQKSGVEKNESGAGKARKKRKNVCDDDAKTVAKKKAKRTAKKCGKPSDEAQSAAGESSECEDKNPSETPFTSKTSVCSHTLSSAVLTDDTTFKPCKATLAEYSKKPYMRVPPSVYLDERFITMPKRRRDLLVLRGQEKVSPEPVYVKPAQQRHRCANCFTTFSNAEELKRHVERQKCSNLFGFDSDDEGNG